MNRYAFGLLVSAAALTGCASMGNMLGHGTDHFYEGEPRPMMEVSVIESNGEAGWGMGSGVSLIATEETCMGTTNRKLETKACDLKAVKFKALTNEA